MIIDDKYINDEQITNITYRKSYLSTSIDPLYKASKFKYFRKSANYYAEIVNQSYEYNEIAQHRKPDKEFYDIEKRIRDKNLENVTKDTYNNSGWVEVKIELSSGTIISHILHSFTKSRLYNLKAQDYIIVDKGHEFVEEEVDIDYVCSMLFGNTKRFTKEKIMI